MKATTRGNQSFMLNQAHIYMTIISSVVRHLRLSNGILFPIPVTLDVSRADIDRLSIVPGRRLALRDPRNEEALAIITGKSHIFSKTRSNHLCHLVEDVYKPDLVEEAIEVFGADDPAHPSVAYLRSRVQDFYIGGKVQAIKLPTHFDYVALRCEIFFLQPPVSIVKVISHSDTPSELRAQFKKLSWRKVVAFQTRNPMHRAHRELTVRAARQRQAVCSSCIKINSRLITRLRTF